MRKHDLSEQPCPVARTLDVVGEWWTLVIVRDAFRGARRFEDFRRMGIADNILSARLKKLVDEGVLERRRYQEHPDRFEYLLTDKGTDLTLVLGALATWVHRWTKGADHSHMTHSECGEGITLQAYCPECDRPIRASEVRVERIKPALLAAG